MMLSLSLLFSLPLSLAVLFSSPGQPGASSSPLTAPLLRGSPVEEGLVEPEAEDLKRMEEGVGLQREIPEASLSSIADSVTSAEYIATRPHGVKQSPFPVACSPCKKFLVGLGCCAAVGFGVKCIVDTLPLIERDAEHCAADVIGRLVDEGCLDRSDLHLISDPLAYVGVQPEQTAGCFSLSEESIHCCSPGVSRSILDIFDWRKVPKAAKYDVEAKVLRKVDSEGVDRELWCKGEEKYASYFSEETKKIDESEQD